MSIKQGPTVPVQSCITTQCFPPWPPPDSRWPGNNPSPLAHGTCVPQSARMLVSSAVPIIQSLSCSTELMSLQRLHGSVWVSSDLYRGIWHNALIVLYLTTNFFVSQFYWGTLCQKNLEMFFYHWHKWLKQLFQLIWKTFFHLFLRYQFDC